MAEATISKKAALITGAAKRLGAEQARSLAKDGWDIAIHYRESEKEAEALAKELQGLGVEAEIFNADLRDNQQLKHLMAQVVEVFPHLSLLINNASIFGRATLMETGAEMFDDHITTNLRAPFLLSRAYAKLVGKGQIINILDAKMRQYELTHFAYLLSKKALAELTLMSARELAPNIRVNGAAVGVTTITDDASDAYFKRLEETLPMGNITEPMEVGEAITWLSRNESLTGQIIYIDAGAQLV